MRDGAGPAVTVVIPVLDGGRTIGDCLDALAAQRDAPRFEIVVVDNGSRDGTPEAVARHPAGARVLRETARGPYAARNTGIAAAAGEVIAFTDADCVPEAGWLAAGLVAIEAGADLVGGAVVQMASRSPTVWERYDRATYLKQDRYVSDQRFAATANLFVRAEVFRALGGFVPDLVASGDLEFGQRATGKGYRLVYAGGAKIRHRPRTTLRDSWALHRKLGSGFAELARFGIRGSAWSDLALRIPLEEVVAAVAADGPPLRRRELAGPHLVCMAARWTGRLTGRG